MIKQRQIYLLETVEIIINLITKENTKKYFLSDTVYYGKSNAVYAAKQLNDRGEDVRVIKFIREGQQ